MIHTMDALLLGVSSLDQPGLARKMATRGDIDVRAILSDETFLRTKHVYPELIQCGYEPDASSDPERFAAVTEAYRTALMDTRCTCLALSVLIETSSGRSSKSMLRKMMERDMFGPEMLQAAMDSVAGISKTAPTQSQS